MVSEVTGQAHERTLCETQHLGPVTALQFHRGLLFVGYGPHLVVYDRAQATYKIRFSQRVLRRNKIHVIAVDEDGVNVAVAGASAVAVGSLETQKFVELEIADWVVTCRWGAISNDGVARGLHVLTAYNKLVVLSTSLAVVSSIPGPDRSLLYSGDLYIQDGRVVVGAGTVMAGVVVWDSAGSRTLRLSDHEGSIFGVRFSANGRRLLTCSDDRSIKVWDVETAACIATGWGHGSRVWALGFAGADDAFFSAGEDGSARLWTLEVGVLHITQSHLWDRCHQGKHVWSAAWDAENGVLATGGADGRLGVLLPDTEQALRTLALELFVKGEKLALVAAGAGKLAVLGSKGTLITGENALLSELPARLPHLAFLRSTGSRIIGFTYTGQPVDLESDEVPAGESPAPQKIINVLASNELWALVPANPHEPLIFVKNGSRYPLERALPHAPTALLATDHGVFVGSRHANLAIYDPQNSGAAPLLSLKICAADTVTSISIVWETNGRTILLVTMRDGFYLFIDVKSDAGVWSAEKILLNKIPRSIEHGSYVNGTLLLAGFRSSCFYLWDETHQVELAVEPCGGAHRVWAYNGEDFVYLAKDGKVCARHMASESRLLQDGTHGREIRSLAFAPSAEADGLVILALAAEDAAVRVGTVSNGRYTALWTLTNHVLGLQSIKFLNDTYLCSSAANEELIIWKITRFDTHVAVIEVARLEAENENPDIRVMDFDFVPTKTGFHVASVYSDSHVKMHHFEPESASLTFVASVRYSTFCVLNVNFLVHGSSWYVLVGTTDGCLTIWDCGFLRTWNSGSETKFSAPLTRQQIHQNAVKTVFVRPLGSDALWSIFSGGDDNALCETRFADGKLEIVAFVEQAAASTITSICSAGPENILVASVDQVLRLWTPSLKCILQTYTTVGDTGCSASFHGIAAVGGAGLSLYYLGDDKNAL